MRVLQLHNHYQQTGGEDIVVSAERDMLVRYGHQVRQWLVANTGLDEASLVSKSRTAMRSIWSPPAYRRLRALIEDFRPDVVHAHNTIPLLSPSVYAAAHDAGRPVVQTVHNYRLVCPGSPLFRDGHVCEECLGRYVPFPSIMHGCFRRSRLQTAVATLGLVSHRLRGTYRRDVDLFIAPTQFTRTKLVEGGFTAESIVVKPHFVSDVEPGVQKDDYGLFAGRLVPGKGVETLLRAWQRLDGAVPLKIVGAGPLDGLLRSSSLRGVEYLGQQSRPAVFALLRRARFLVFPSEWYETFGMAIIEAFAAAVPVVTSRHGSMAELVEDGKSGWHFETGSAEDLARVVREAWSSPDELRRRAGVARMMYEQKYSLARNYEMILSVYGQAVHRFRARTCQPRSSRTAPAAYLDQ